MSALDELVTSDPPSKRKRPPEGVMDKILTAIERGFSYTAIAAALTKDGHVTSKEMVSRWVREHDERVG